MQSWRFGVLRRIALVFLVLAGGLLVLKDARTPTRQLSGHPLQRRGGYQCDPTARLIIGVIETWTPLSPDPRRAKVRSNIRETWIKLINTSSSIGVDVRFVLGFPQNNVPKSIQIEMATYGDILIVSPTPSEHPYSLLPKVVHFHHWAAGVCNSAEYILKTNEHAFVHVNKIQHELSAGVMSSTNTVFGRIMRNQKAGAADSENYHKLLAWPPYPSGSGYIVTRDISQYLGNFVNDSTLRYEFEDRAVGLVLAGLASMSKTSGYGPALRMVNGQEQFRPWGHCTADTLILHYQSHDKLLRRRYARALSGASICGQGYPTNQVCKRAEYQKSATFSCANGTVLSKVLFATYSRTNKYIGPRYPWCKEGPSAHEVDSDCRLPDTVVREHLEKQCLGRITCDIKASEKTFVAQKLDCASDARGWERPQLLATLECQ